MRKNKLFILAAFLVFGCSHGRSFLIDNENAAYEIFIAKPEENNVVLSIGELNWIKISNEDKDSLNTKLGELKSATNLASCQRQFFLKIINHDCAKILDVDVCDYVWAENGVFKGVSTEFWKSLKAKYLQENAQPFTTPGR